MKSFVAALQFLTGFSLPERGSRSPDELGPAAGLFPVIGLLLGAVLALIDFPLRLLASPGLSSVILVAILALLTRGLHLDGLGDTFDALGASGGRERMLRIMDDSHTGAFGLIAIVLVILLKIEAIQSIDTERWRALLAAPVLSRWAMVLLGYRSQAAKPGLGSTLMDHLETKHFLLATLITVILIAAVLRGTGIALIVWIALFSLLSKKYFFYRLGGLTGDIFGALGELSEASVLVFLALGAR